MGTGRKRPWRDPGLPAVNFGVRWPESTRGAARTSVRSGSQRGGEAGPAAGTPAVLSRPLVRGDVGPDPGASLRSSAPAAPRLPQVVR